MSMELSELELGGRVALVTGATSGIGAVSALELGRMGAFVVGTATTPEGVEIINSNFQDHGIDGAGMQLNLRDRDTFEDRIDQVARVAGRSASILFNNAGIMIDKLTPRMKSEHWDPVIEVDLTGTFFLTQAVMAAMKRRESGRIITNSSVIALTGNRGQANYAAAKAGLIAVNKTWVQEYAGRPWTFNVVCPGPINTAMIQDLPDGVKESFASRIPAGFLGEPEDVASLVGYLASPRARYINGQVIAIDGGLTA